LANVINPDLTFREGVGETVGALDLGGGSAQIVFQPDDIDLDLKITGEEDFFVHSYLSYGADQMRERLWDMLILDDDKVGTSAIDTPILNPCAFVGWEQEWKGRRLQGTGASASCALDLLRVFRADVSTAPLQGGVDDNLNRNALPTSTRARAAPGRQLDISGVRHPPVRGKFYAMSLFFFALDCVRELSVEGARAAGQAAPFVDRWPSPTVNDLFAALEPFCEQRWEDLEPKASEVHKYTRADGLPHRCLEAVYIATLLRDAYGFDGDGRDITFVLHVNEMEVEWTLGFLMFDVNRERA
jgi:hypothetical protein